MPKLKKSAKDSSLDSVNRRNRRKLNKLQERLLAYPSYEIVRSKIVQEFIV